jgi:hypothetical protein
MKSSPSLRRALSRSARSLTGLSLVLLAGCHDSSSGPPTVSADFVRHWSEIAIDASGLDHTPSNQGPAHTFGHQVGPCRASRAMAIVHVAMFEALNAIRGEYPSAVGLVPFEGEASVRAAIAQAAHDTLAALFPSQAYLFADDLAATLDAVTDGSAETNGIVVGQAAAQAVLADRAGDGSAHPEQLVNTEYVCSDQPGFWRQDPVSLHPLALGAQWETVEPWVLLAADQFRCPIPPQIDSPEYAVSYAEVYALGGDGVATPTLRTEEQTFVGIFWAYDGMPSLCAPPRLYNQVVHQVAEQTGLRQGHELARLLALVNVAMADAGIASWESKYFHEVWRPITGIRESDVGSGPSGLGDGNPLTAGDPGFMPLGAPASNTTGPNFTPPFPAYPSGHATFGGALFQTLRRFYGTDDVTFTFVSDEFDGTTLDADGNLRPYRPRTFTSFSQAEEENGQSRIYLGIHWSFDKVAGIDQGNAVADWVVDHLYVAP